MVRGARGRFRRKRAAACGIAFAATALFSAGLAALATAAEPGPYEPNDTLLTAVGPLAAGQSYSGAIESGGDRDYFYFYATSAEEAEVELHVRNAGGGTEISDIDATIINTSATPVGGISFVRKGETRVASFWLEPEKYFIEISSKEGFGDTYTLTAGGSSGAFGGYDSIARRCSKASDRESTLRTRLRKAKQRLQRATSRLRRARYADSSVRQEAREELHLARKHVTTKMRELNASQAAQLPWCAIPR